MTWFFQKFSRKPKPQTKSTDTIPVAERTALNVTTQEPPKASAAVSDGNLNSPAQLFAVIGHSMGMQRENNEDALFSLTTSLVSDTRNIPFGLYIVADGMGGHQHGEIASATAVRIMAGHVSRKLYLPLFNVQGSSLDQSLQEVMTEGILEAHRAILQEEIGGGTTMTAALVIGEKVTIAHAGDCRAYAIDMNGEFRILTRDHSLVKRLEELGQITPEESAIHPQRNVLYRALGQGEAFEPDVYTSSLPCPGYLLLCSDGLWGVVDQKEIIHLVTSSSSTQIACQKLVEAANASGGPDNISAILVRIPASIG